MICRTSVGTSYNILNRLKSIKSKKVMRFESSKTVVKMKKYEKECVLQFEKKYLCALHLKDDL
jgi:hypothetical protein